MRILRKSCLCLLTFFCLSCSTSMSPEDFAGTTPEFRIEEYFSGTTKAWGLVFNRSGNLQRQFTVTLQGSMRDGVFVLEEDFVFSDGETDRRVWNIVKKDEHTYEGTASDVVGKAIGKRYGQALYWNYELNLKVDDSTYRIHFDDWMFLQEGSVLANRAVMSKFGFTVGEIVIFFQKHS